MVQNSYVDEVSFQEGWLILCMRDARWHGYRPEIGTRKMKNALLENLLMSVYLKVYSGVCTRMITIKLKTTLT